MEEDDKLLLTGIENSVFFEKEWKRHASVHNFLSNHEYITIRSTNISAQEIEYALSIKCDIDGVTIEWKKLSNALHEFHHLFLLPKGKLSLIPVYPLLKKHENLIKYNVESRKMFKECVGAQIFTDGGWGYVIALLPNGDRTVKLDFIRDLTYSWFVELKAEFRKRLITAIPLGYLKHTLDKNDMNNIGKLFLLPNDSKQIMKMFQETFDSTNVPFGFRKIIFSYRFGEKNNETVFLPIAESSDCVKVCVHVGATVECVLDDESIFWSRSGLENVTGNRGCLTTVLSMVECANYQSNLDGRDIDVRRDLMEVCKYPENVQFVQLYADVPHCYPTSRYHAVSAALMYVHGMRGATSSLEDDARHYISVIGSNFMKMYRSDCRLEFVVSLDKIKNTIEGEEMLSIPKLTKLLQQYALLVPFSSQDLMDCCRKIGFHLCDTLQELLNDYKGTGCSESVWKAYQYELAAEKLLWGHPLSYKSNAMSVNLGPGLSSRTRSSTDFYGFLRLEPHFACCSDERTTPPLLIYSKSECVQSQLNRLFGFWDYIAGSNLVLGRRLVEMLIVDLHTVGCIYERYEPFIKSLKSGAHSMRVVGVTSKSQLAKQLTLVKNYKLSMVHQHALKMLKRSGKDLEEVLINGFEEVKLCHFPAFRNFDKSRNQSLYWEFGYGVWTIRDFGDLQAAPLENRSSLLCALVLNELEKRKLCYTSSLKGTNNGFPWVRDCLRKLDEQKFDEETLTKIMTFLTCVAFLEKGRFVEYNKLRKLEGELPVRQWRFVELEIQSKILVNNMNVFKVRRLHASISRKETETASLSRPNQEMQRRIPDQPSNNMEENIPRIDENLLEEYLEDTVAEKSVTQKHLPCISTVTWNSIELGILGTLKENVKESSHYISLYNQYQAECRKFGIPDRSFHAFRAKLKRFTS